MTKIVAITDLLKQSVEQKTTEARRKQNTDLSFLFVVLGQPFEFLKKHKCLMRWNLKTFAASFAGQIIINAKQVISNLLKKLTIVIAGARRNLGFFGSANPSDLVIISPTTTGTLVV